MNYIYKREGLNIFSNSLRDMFLIEYDKHIFNTKTDILSYNRVRKIIDLYLQHLVSMARELDNVRKRIIPFLFLPLDSKIFISKDIFTEDELKRAGINRNSSYGSLKSRDKYDLLQNLLIDKSIKLSEKDNNFSPVYFDLIWQSKNKIPRYRSWGNNLFRIRAINSQLSG